MLGLGANALKTYEFGRNPLSSDSATSSFFLRSYNVLSAVHGTSSPGYLAYGSLGLNESDSSGSNFVLELFARSSSITKTSPERTLLKISVLDTSSSPSTVVAQQDFTTKDFALKTAYSYLKWNSLRISFTASP